MNKKFFIIILQKYVILMHSEIQMSIKKSKTSCTTVSLLRAANAIHFSNCNISHSIYARNISLFLRAHGYRSKVPAHYGISYKLKYTKDENTRAFARFSTNTKIKDMNVIARDLIRDKDSTSPSMLPIGRSDGN